VTLHGLNDDSLDDAEMLQAQLEVTSASLGFTRQTLLKLSCCGSGASVQLNWKREFKLPWREAGPPNHLDDKVESDQ